jgi:hypothetical protein
MAPYIHVTHCLFHLSRACQHNFAPFRDTAVRDRRAAAYPAAADLVDFDKIENGA